MQYSALLNALNRPALLWSMSGSLLAANPLFGEVCGIAQPPCGTVWPALRERAKLFKTVSSSPTASVVTTFDLGEDGHGIAAQCQLRALFEDGVPVAVLGLCETEASHLFGNALGQELYRNFNAATEVSHIIVFTMDPESGEMRLSSSFATLVGVAQDSPPHHLRNLSDWAHPEDYEKAKPWFEALARGEIQRFNGDLRLYCDGVGWVWSNIKAQMRDRSAIGLPPVICGCAVDVSHYKSNADRLEEAYQQAEEARRTELALRKEARDTHELLRVAALAGRIGPFTVCPERQESWMLPETYAMFGYTAEDFEGIANPRMQIIHPDDLDDARRARERLFAREVDTYDHISRQRHKDGSYHWYRTVACLVDRSEDGLPPLMAGVSSNIDQLKQNEAKLALAIADIKASRDRLNRLADNAPTALYEVHVLPDGSFSIPYFSAKTPEIFGVDALRLRNDPACALRQMVPDDQLRFMEKAKEAHKSLTPFSIEVQVQRLEGGLRWVQIATNPQRGPDGRIISYASVTDVTDRKTAVEEAANAAERARATHERLTKLANNAPAALYEYRKEATGEASVPFFSTKLPEMFGVTDEAIARGMPALFEHVLPEDYEALKAISAEAISRNECFSADLRVMHPKHGLRWLQLASNPQKVADGAVLRYASVSDITPVREAERRAKEAVREVQIAHDRLNRLTENTNIGLFEAYQAPDGSEKLVYCNSTLVSLIGTSKERLKQDLANRLDAIHPEDRTLVEQARQTSIETLKPYEVQFRVQHPERGEISLLSRMQPRRHEDGGLTWYGCTVDLTERLEMERKAAAAAREAASSHARLSSLADAAPVGLFEMTPYGQEPSGFVYTSARYDDLMGVTGLPEDEKFDAVLSRTNAEDMQKAYAYIDKLLETGEPETQRIRVQHPSRGLCWFSLSAVVKKTAEEKVSIVGAMVDITKDVEVEAKLRAAHEMADRMRMENEVQAMHDPLTGLPNRRSFDRTLADRFAAAASGEDAGCIGLIRIDGDRFKYINDTFGHEAGDAVLQRIADVMRQQSGSDDFPARIGGDEFSILLPQGADEAHGTALIKRIQDGIAEPLYFKGRPCVIQASFGLACIDRQQDGPTDLLAFADAALYRAKEKGRNRMELFTPALRQEIVGTRQLASELQDALIAQSFEPFFQPQIDTATGELFGLEVLMRWRHPERGILTPDQFLGVADQLRIVPDLDRLMMQKTHQTLLDLRSRGLNVPKVSFNVSSGRMLDDDLLTSADALLRDGFRLTVELLESTLVEEEGEVFNFHLDSLREMGIEIEIDDFGSGHASIIALMAVAPSALKIDRRIIAPVAGDVRARKLVRAIIEIAETLEINTIAEGVEQEAQVRILRDLGCNLVQGFHYSRPLDATAFEAWLRTGEWLARKVG